VTASTQLEDIADHGEGLGIGPGRHHPALIFMFKCWHLGIILTSRTSCIAGHEMLMLTSEDGPVISLALSERDQRPPALSFHLNYDTTRNTAIKIRFENYKISEIRCEIQRVLTLRRERYDARDTKSANSTAKWSADSTARDTKSAYSSTRAIRCEIHKEC
jgi:hypothetical protein